MPPASQSDATPAGGGHQADDRALTARRPRGDHVALHLETAGAPGPPKTGAQRCRRAPVDAEAFQGCRVDTAAYQPWSGGAEHQRVFAPLPPHHVRQHAPGKDHRSRPVGPSDNHDCGREDTTTTAAHCSGNYPLHALTSLPVGSDALSDARVVFSGSSCPLAAGAARLWWSRWRFSSVGRSRRGLGCRHGLP